MRKSITISIGAATAAIALTTGAGAALATSGSHQQVTGTAAAAAHKQITKAQAGRIAKAKVPHSHVIEIQSDDRHDRPVWKVTLGTRHGRVIVDVDKKTGKATIVRRGGGGDGREDAAGATAMSVSRSGGNSGSDSARDAREDRRDDRGQNRREDRREDRRDDRRDHRGHDHDGAGHR